MRSTIILLIGLSTVLLFLSIYGIPYVNGQASNPNNKTSNENSVLQTENLDPFLPRGSNNDINTGSANNPSQANDGSTNNNKNDGSSNNNDDGTSQANDGSTNNNKNDGSTNNNKNDNKKGSDSSKSSEVNKHSKPSDIPFP
jgi:penicillin-binding protein 1A